MQTAEQTVSRATPGCWEVHEHAPYSVWAGETQVAACRILLDDGNWDGYFPKTSDEVKANALLIAAAPDLLAIAKAVYYKAAGLLNGTRVGQDLVDALGDAIQKAEGR